MPTELEPAPGVVHRGRRVRHTLPKTLLVVNPASAGGKTFSRFGALRDALDRSGVEVDIRLTVGPHEATRLTRDAIDNGYEQVVAVGGDGTLNEVINGYFDANARPINPDVAVGLIPSGTGGDFRRSLGVMTVDAAIDVLIAGHTRQIDAAHIEMDANALEPPRSHYFINIADWGVGGEVVARINRNRFKAGGMRGTALFLGTSILELFTYGFYDVELMLDGTRLQRRISNVVVANGAYFGGGMRIAPRARLDDGLFDVVVVSEMSKWRQLNGIARIYRGSHINTPGIELFRAQQVRIVPKEPRPMRFEAEGEEVGTGAGTVTCLAKAVRFIVPERAARST